MLGTITRNVVRQAQRHPLYVGLNVFGLALGIGVFLTLLLLVRFEYSYNSGLADVDRLFRLDAIASNPGTETREYASTTFYALPFLRQDFPNIENSVRIEEGSFQVRLNGTLVPFWGAFVDPSIMDVFGLRLTHGLPNALDRPDGIVLSENAAKRIFGTSDVVGRIVTVDIEGQMSRHSITAVTDGVVGPNFLSNFEMMIPISTEHEKSSNCYSRWGSDCGNIYLKLKNVHDQASIQTHLRDFVMHRAAGDNDIGLGPHPEKTYALTLAPLRNERFYDAHVLASYDGVERSVIDGIGLVGLLALALACANAINLATARSVLRAREVAIRKTLGGTRKVLLVQFIGESLVLTLVAGLVGIALCELLVPVIASLTGENITMSYGFVFVVLLIVILGCGLSSGLYPALILSGYRPARVLAAARMPSGGRMAARLRDGLIIGQFAIAITIIIGMLVIHQQTEFLKRADQGFMRSGLLIGPEIPSEDVTTQQRMHDRLASVPGVWAVTYGMLAPRPDSKNQTTFTYDSSSGPVRVQLLRDIGDANYLRVYQPRMLAGRWFDVSRGQDSRPDYKKTPTATTHIILNQTAATRFGFASPADAISKVIKDGDQPSTIIGVMANMRFESPRQSVYPEIITFNPYLATPFSQPIPAVRFSGVPTPEMERRLELAWSSVLPDVAGHFQTADARLEKFYRGDEQRERIFTLGAVAAVAIAALGLYGLSAFAAARRVHEVGIRKTLGATSLQVMVLLLRDFLRPVMIASLIACPIAWIIMRDWLSAFDERISLGPMSFIIAVGGALIIAGLTVLGQTIHLARAEPARALRAE
ncbi:putative ABC transporter permease [Neokomagataea thailandica NBRC 106555]|uniref:ABC transporter permease n=2 Tax=Neokomagataea TaxID=1223423 RepID=A0A4Y6V5Q2_9PROT|nr:MULTISPECIES: ABC transporter permease [Neokomagataea]QDH25452.1 ABC transporter permease [Neokomagataea tanensis]GBR50755.1 putative ABC transporter permease [Neokomagataea thailandica NBRC 106555]